jgi:phage terminase small subunit
VQSRYLAIANRQAEIMMRIASEFGFTPASRSRIATPSKTEPTLFDVLEEPPARPLERDSGRRVKS